MNKVLNFIGLLWLPLMLMAQGQGLQIALKGGACTWQSGQPLSTVSPETGLDLNYLVRWRIGTYTQLGLHTGLGVSYSSYSLKQDVTNQFTNRDYNGLTIHYTTAAHAVEKHYTLGVSLPVLFAMQTHGVTINLGPRLLWIPYDHYQQTIDQSAIDAFYPAYGVHVLNQPSTGLLPTPYSKTDKNPMNALHLLFSAELGYEWQLGNPYSRWSEQWIGVQLYANYGVWNWSEHSSEPFVAVGNIRPNSYPQISTRSLPSDILKYMSVGLRLYYTIQSVDYHGHGWHRSRPFK